MSWLVRLLVTGAEVDTVSNTLWALGTTGVAEVPAADERVELLAGYADREDADSATHALLALDISSLFAAPPIVEPVSAWATPPASTIEFRGLSIKIDAGTSFGHGRHPTTELALGLLLDDLERLDHSQEAPSVLDLGTGSGILAIAASLAGAGRVLGIDRDPEAVEIARRNAADNAVAAVDFSCQPLLDVLAGESFDLVVANMLVADLSPLAPTLRSCPRLIFSGMLSEQLDLLLDLFPDHRQSQSRQSGEWAGLALAITVES